MAFFHHAGLGYNHGNEDRLSVQVIWVLMRIQTMHGVIHNYGGLVGPYTGASISYIPSLNNPQGCVSYWDLPKQDSTLG